MIHYFFVFSHIYLLINNEVFYYYNYIFVLQLSVSMLCETYIWINYGHDCSKRIIEKNNL